MHKEYILLNGFRKAKRGFTAGFHVPLSRGDKDMVREKLPTLFHYFLKRTYFHLT